MPILKTLNVTVTVSEVAAAAIAVKTAVFGPLLLPVNELALFVKTLPCVSVTETAAPTPNHCTFTIRASPSAGVIGPIVKGLFAGAFAFVAFVLKTMLAPCVGFIVPSPRRRIARTRIPILRRL